MNFMHLRDIVAGTNGWAVSIKDVDGVRQIECRKKFGDGNLLMIVANEGKGYNHKFYKASPDRWDRSTLAYDMHWSTNGPLQLTFADMDDIYTVAKKARLVLEGDS